ncbi:putative ribonuclease H-like domain-containing protein [Tanacetum coccineum]
MQEELLQFQLSRFGSLVNLPNGKRAIGTKWVFRNKKDERGVVVRNKARLVAQGYTQEEGIDYDEIFAPVARIEVIRLFLAYASFMGFIFVPDGCKECLTIEEEVYVCQSPAPRAWYETLSTYLIENGFRRGTIDKTLFIKKYKGDILLVQMYVDDIIFGSTKKSYLQQKKDEIFISQYKYVAEVLKKFDFATVKTTSTPMEPNKALIKDEEADSVDVHLYRSMIGSLMYLTASSAQTYVCCLCLRKRLISWQCKKQTIVANSTTEAEYVAAANCCGQVSDEVVHKDLGDRMERAATTASSLEAESDLHLEDAGGIDCLLTATIFEELARMGGRGKIYGLKKRVQKLERKKKSRTTRLKRLRKVGESSRVESSEAKESLGAQEDASKQGRIKIVDETQGRLDDAEMFNTDDLHGDEVIVDMAVGEKQEKSAKIDEREVSTGVVDSVAPTISVTTADEGVTATKIDEFTPTSTPTTVIDELTLAQTLIEIKAAKPKAITTAATTTTTRPKARGVIVQEASEFKTTTSSSQASQASKTKDKGKAIMIEPEVPLKRKDQVALDKEMARNLEA